MSDNPTRLLERCFVSGSNGTETRELARMLAERGVAVTTPRTIKSTAPITQEILRLIAESDFVAAIIGERGRDSVMYELGVARTLEKPAFIILVGGRLPFDLSGIFVRAVEPGQLADAGDDLDRFIRNAKPPPPIASEPPTGKGVDLGWARDELAKLRSGTVNSRERNFESLVQRVFEAASADVTTIERSGLREQVDFIVWQNEVAFETGGPILVECKVLRGGSGSVIKNAEAYVKRLAKTVDESDATLAMLVFDHDRPNVPPSPYETPKVLSFTVDDLIGGLERGTLGTEILRRRRRAAFALESDK